MKLLTYNYNDNEYIGILAKDQLSIITLAHNGYDYESINDLICKNSLEILENLIELYENVTGDILLKDVKLIAPIPQPKQDIICLGKNYAAHAEECDLFKNDEKNTFSTIYFSKRAHEIVGDGGVIQSHRNIVDSLDYEVELAVVIGKDAKNVVKEKVYDYILGYSIFNDISARNIQKRHEQWYFGKSLDGFSVMGPWIVTAEEFSQPPQATIRCKVNGELRQDSHTSLMLTTIEEAIVELSQGMTLKAGTIIAMGTPAGVGMGFNPPKYLHSGDIIECEIEGIGVLKNKVE